MLLLRVFLLLVQIILGTFSSDKDLSEVRNAMSQDKLTLTRRP